MDDMTMPVWDDAFGCWRSQVIVAFQNIRPHSSQNTVQMLRASVNRSICDFCAGPCGNCTRKYSMDPTDCDDCPQDRFGGLTECDTCPYRSLRECPGAHLPKQAD